MEITRQMDKYKRSSERPKHRNRKKRAYGKADSKRMREIETKMVRLFI